MRGLRERAKLALMLLLAAVGQGMAAEADKFALRHCATGRCFGLYEYADGASLLDGRATLRPGTGLTFRVEFFDRGVGSTCGPFAFTNEAPVVLGPHEFRLVLHGLADVRAKLAGQEAAEKAFRDAQRAKSLVEHGGGWVTTNALRAARESEAARLAGERRMAALPATARCPRCGGTGLIRKGTETVDGLACARYSECPACKGDGRNAEAPVSPPPTATTTQTNAAPSATVAADPNAPRKLTPVGFRKPGGGSSGGIKRLGE
jgi:hypothetical protein